MANNNEKNEREQPPKIELHRTENNAPAKAHPLARPFIPSKIKTDPDAPKKRNDSYRSAFGNIHSEGCDSV